MTSKYTNKLQGKRVLVLGGTSGIGFCVAENALEHGATVIVASSRQSSIDKTLQRFKDTYPDQASHASGHVIDLRSPESEKGIVELLAFATNNAKDLLDHIVNTAGDSLPIAPLAAFEGADMLAAGQRVRTLTTLFIAKHAPGKYLKVSKTSSITFTGGVNTYRPGQYWYQIAMGGAGMQGLARGLAVDLRPIRVNVVEPGAINTELFQRNFTKEQLEGYKENFKKESLTGDMGTPEDMSEAYLYLMKDYFMTGQTVLSEGGCCWLLGCNDELVVKVGRGGHLSRMSVGDEVSVGYNYPSSY